MAIFIITDIKEAMLSKNVVKLEVCRAIKSAILIEKTNKVGVILNEEKELQILQKLLKQRREAEKIYNDQSIEKIILLFPSFHRFNTFYITSWRQLYGNK